MEKTQSSMELFQEQCCEHTFVLLGSEVSPPTYALRGQL